MAFLIQKEETQSSLTQSIEQFKAKPADCNGGEGSHCAPSIVKQLPQQHEASHQGEAVSSARSEIIEKELTESTVLQNS